MKSTRTVGTQTYLRIYELEVLAGEFVVSIPFEGVEPLDTESRNYPGDDGRYNDSNDDGHSMAIYCAEDKSGHQTIH